MHIYQQICQHFVDFSGSVSGFFADGNTAEAVELAFHARLYLLYLLNIPGRFQYPDMAITTNKAQKHIVKLCLYSCVFNCYNVCRRYFFPNFITSPFNKSFFPILQHMNMAYSPSHYLI